MRGVPKKVYFLPEADPMLAEPTEANPSPG